MDKAIAWYLVELERELNGRLDRGDVEASLQEVEAHLVELRSELLLPPVELRPEDLIARFGEPRQIAIALASAYHREPSSARLVPFLLVAILCVLGFGPFAAMYWSSAISPEVPFPTLAVFATAPLVAVSLFARRLHVRAIALGSLLSAVTMAVVMAAGAIDLGEPDGFAVILRRDAPKEVANLAASNRQMRAELARLETGMAAFAARADKAGEGAFVVPGMPERLSGRFGVSVPWSVTTSLSEARESWRRASMSMAQIRSEISSNEESIGALSAGGHTFIVQLRGFAGSVVPPTMILFLFTLGLNGAIQGIRWAAKHVRTQKGPRIASA